MASDWFYSRNDEKHGPISSVELRQLARSGVLLPTDLIWKEGMPTWVKASSAKDLFGSTPQPPQPQEESTHNGPTVGIGHVVAARARSAARLAGLAAEKTKILSVILPGAYVALGKYAYAHRDDCTGLDQHLSRVATLGEQIQVASQPSQIEPADAGIAAKAKAVAAKGLQVALSQKLALQQVDAYRQLGKACYEAEIFSDSQADSVGTIRQSLDRLATIDAEYRPTTSSSPGMRKWLIRSSLAAAAVLVLLAGGSLIRTRGRSQGPSQWELEMEQQKQAQTKQITELLHSGNEAWDAGKKADSVGIYIQLLDSCDDVIHTEILKPHKAALAQAAARAIDALVDSKNTAAAKKLILIADKTDLTVAFTNPESNALAEATIRAKKEKDQQELQAIRDRPASEGSGFRLNGDHLFNPTAENSFNPTATNGFSPGDRESVSTGGVRKARDLASRIRQGMSKGDVASLCGGTASDRMPVGKGEIWLYSLGDGSTLTVTFDMRGEVVLASDVTDKK